MRRLILGDARVARIVPPSGFTATLVLVSSGAMAFLAVLALALTLTAARVAEAWETALDRTATVRIASSDAAVADRVVALLESTDGISRARVLTGAEQQALLEPWLGPDLDLGTLTLPTLIEVVEEPGGPDSASLNEALAEVAPGAAYDRHAVWREDAARAAGRLRAVGWIALGLISLVTATVVALGASSAMAANGQIVDVLRLVGAEDRLITNAFVRRFTIRAAAGAAVGVAFAIVALAFLPGDTGAGFGQFGYFGWEWVLVILVPPAAALLAFAATRAAALRRLRKVS